MSARFTEGQDVLARWSDGLFYLGTVTKVGAAWNVLQKIKNKILLSFFLLLLVSARKVLISLFLFLFFLFPDRSGQAALLCGF